MTRSLAITFELLSPGGGAGCIYRHRPVPGALVIAGSLLSGGLLLYAVQHDDPDSTIVSAVAYAVMRTIGLVAVSAEREPPTSVRSSSSLDPSPRPVGALLPTAARPLGFSYGFAF